jgi:UDP-GlcNAc:undecaprenyl-phosphate GlcNAc-1-phosphate transferase
MGAMSTPGGRHVHARAIPRLGGIAIALAWIVPVVYLFLASGLADTIPLRSLVGLVGGATLLCAVGAVDDVRGLPAAHKLIAQVAVSCFAFGCGFQITAVQLPLIGTLSMGVFALPVTVLWIVGVTNAVNLIDGLDGLAAGVSFVAALTSFIIAMLSGSWFVATATAALMGALVGFLFFNFNPARIFMGDSGSYFLGYVLATLSLAGTLQQKASTAVSLLVPILALGLPIFDTLLSLLRRFLARRPLFAADRLHVHHRLLDLGLTHRRAVIVLYGISTVFAGGAITISLGRSWQVGVALVSVTVVVIGLVRFLGYFDHLHLQSRQKSRLRDSWTESLRGRLPGYVVAAARAKSEQEALGPLEQLARDRLVTRAEIITEGSVVFGWGARIEYNSSRRDALELVFPIGDESNPYSVRFTCIRETDEIPPSAEILLQVAVDAVTHALKSCNSVLVMARESEDKVTAALPAIAR